MSKLKIKNLKFKINPNGFTLIETLVAISILTIAIVGPLTIVSRGVFFSNYAKDQITAVYLSQEAIEYLRNRRDANIITSGTWNQYKTNIINPCMIVTNPDGCAIDVTVPDSDSDDISRADIIPCDFLGCPNLNRNIIDGTYGYGTDPDWETSQFKRFVKVYSQSTVGTEDPYDANELRVEVKVEWVNGVTVKNFVINESLFNWQ
ncbi:MAG: prepilin-type N-terminal cleavage/methylation domain-containing protein [Patescibacteria group bacterium]